MKKPIYFSGNKIEDFEKKINLKPPEIIDWDNVTISQTYADFTDIACNETGHIPLDIDTGNIYRVFNLNIIIPGTTSVRCLEVPYEKYIYESEDKWEPVFPYGLDESIAEDLNIICFGDQVI